MTQYIVKYKTVSSVKTRYALNAQENNGGKEKESLRYSDNRNLRHVRNPRQFRVGHSRRSTDAHRDEQTEHAVNHLKRAAADARRSGRHRITSRTSAASRDLLRL